MALSLATSGAIVLSDVGRLQRLFWQGIDGIEIGSLRDAADLDVVVASLRDRGLALAVHAPLWRHGPTRMACGPQGPAPDTVASLRRDMAVAAAVGAQYALCHAPWLADHERPWDAATQDLRACLHALAQLQAAAGLPLALELKLGVQRDPGVLWYIAQHPHVLGDLHGLSLCLDVGDWLLACEALDLDPDAAYRPLAAATAVVHVHAVERRTTPYLWKPIHPSDPDAAAVLALCRLVARERPDVSIVLEHTPHLDPGETYDLEGFAWLRSALGAATA